MNLERAHEIQGDLAVAGFRVEVIAVPLANRPIARPERQRPVDIEAHLRVWMGYGRVTDVQRITEYVTAQALEFFLPSASEGSWWSIIEGSPA